jgi:hypothetical protein
VRMTKTQREQRADVILSLAAPAGGALALPLLRGSAIKTPLTGWAHHRKSGRLVSSPGARSVPSVARGLPFILATTPVMQFRIEITCETDISSKVIYRATIDEITAARAKTKAAALLDLYAGRGANSARVLNPKNEVIFRL